MTPDALLTLLSDPSRADALPREALPELLGAVGELSARVERLRAMVWARLMSPEASQSRSDIERASGDRLLTVAEVAERLSIDERAVYRRADRWPFTRRLGGRTLRFSERGLEEWLRRKQTR